MSAYLALALSVGLLAVLDTWLYIGPLGTSLVAGLIWVSFIAWGCHFHSGGGTKGTTTTVVCMTWGAVVGLGAVLLATGPLASLDAPVAFGIAVGLGAALICLSSKVPLLATIPASVYGFASIAGALPLHDGDPKAAILPTVLSVLIGAAFGFVSEKLAGVLTKSAPAA
jgi:threonine/homoserine efflux transporter RhtA